MKAAAVMDKMDDLLNPIAVKELRQAVKSRIIVSALIVFLIVQLSILLLNLSFSDRPSFDQANLHAGRQNFLILQGILLGTCMLLVPAYAGVRLSAEHSDTNVDLLFISTLRPRGIIIGKLQAAVVLVLLIFSACAPFMTFTYLLRGIDIPSIVLVLFLDFLVVLLGTQIAIFLGAIPATTGLKLLLGLFGLGILASLFGYTTAACVGFLELGLGSRLLDSSEFWLSAAAVTILIAATIGLLFTWSVAIVSPPSANRALSVRLYLLGFWLVTGVTTALLTRRIRSPIPIFFWEVVMVVLLCIQIAISINEREQWGMRIQRTIPRRRWLRGLAFLTYSGAAGGILFAVLLIAVTIGLGSVPLHLWVDPSPMLARFESEMGQRTALALTMLALYAFDYCMLAVWVRILWLHTRIKATYTWVLAMTLGALGLSLPWPLLFLFQNEELRRNQIDPWWQITNPFSTILTCVEFNRNPEAEVFSYMSLLVLGSLALILLVACGRWFGGQIKRFHPPEKEIAG